jgi:hypothetical protein
MNKPTVKTSTQPTVKPTVKRLDLATAKKLVGGAHRC